VLVKVGAGIRESVSGLHLVYGMMGIGWLFLFCWCWGCFKGGCHVWTGETALSTNECSDCFQLVDELSCKQLVIAEHVNIASWHSLWHCWCWGVLYSAGSGASDSNDVGMLLPCSSASGGVILVLDTH